MILATRYSGDVQLRSAFPDRSFPPSRTMFAPSGVAVNVENSVGIPAVGRAIRLVASMGASLDLDVFQGEGAEKRERKDAYPAALLDMPVAGMSAFDWRYDVFAALEACENFCALKTKARGQVQELLPIPMEFVQIRRDAKTQQKLFDVPGEGGRTLTLTSADVFHVRGNTPYGGIAGVSRIAQHRDPVGSQLAAQRFEGAFFRNNARPDIVMEFPQGVSIEQGRQWKEEWDAVHAGVDNAGKSRAIGGGATIKPVPVSMADAQFLESKRYGVEETGRMMDVHPLLLEDISNIAAGLLAEALDFFVAVQFTPRLRRVEQAFRADPDLFKPTGTLYPLFKASDLSFASATTRATVQHQKIQDGSLLPDEVRAEDGRPPLPDGLGMIPQVTPVGGAPNPTVKEPAAPQENSYTVPSIELRVNQDMEPLAREQGAAYANFSSALDSLAGKIGGLLEAFGDVDERRERRDVERQKAQDDLARSQARALEAVGQPNIVVNVEPTPVTVEAPVTVNVPTVPVQLSIELPPEREKKIVVERNKNGLIESATVTED